MTNMHISEWQPFSDLRPIQYNISDLGYNKKYIEEHRLEEIKIFHWCNTAKGIMNFCEPLEVKEENNNVFWRYNEEHIHMDLPKVFETQFGIFNNHNNGEFTSWLGKDDYNGLSEDKKELYSLYGWGDFFIEGNYVDMFDCGEYTYAISNLLHMSQGIFKIIRINKKLDSIVMFENCRNSVLNRLEYAGRFKNAKGYVVIASGFLKSGFNKDIKEFRDITVLFQIDEKGDCVKSREWEISISSANSMVAVGDFVYFGQNKMITQLNILTGETAFFTNKTDDELAALVKMW